MIQIDYVGENVLYKLSYSNSINTGTLAQARREPQRVPRKHSRGASKHFHGAPLERNFLNFSFQNGRAYILAYFIFLADGGAPQTSRGPG